MTDAYDIERILTHAPKDALDSRMTVTTTVGRIKKTYTGTVRALVVLGLLYDLEATAASAHPDSHNRRQ